VHAWIGRDLFWWPASNEGYTNVVGSRRELTQALLRNRICKIMLHISSKGIISEIFPLDNDIRI
jgi:hypothetical protein